MDTLFELPPETTPAKPVRRQWFITLTIGNTEYFVYLDYNNKRQIRPMSELHSRQTGYGVRPLRFNEWQKCHGFMKRHQPTKYPDWDGTYKIVEWVE